ncbi:MAG: restriction endonuclease subunit R [Flavobacterium sp. BFFFF2]|nr:MAG: restriction endonuclease subunit R [Flavobacterium sp. BFFFF2]
MQALQFPAYGFRFKSTKNGPAIFDVIRKKFIVLTPEEWVRQHVIHWLLNEYHIPANRLAVEQSFQVHGMTRRSDIAVYLPSGALWLLVECKAPEVPISQSTFDQIARYNKLLDSQYLMVTNGLNHYFCLLNDSKDGYVFLHELPELA